MTPPRRGSSNSLSVPMFMAVIATLYLAREILIPLAFAVTLTFILAPAVAWLMKLRFKRAPAALVVVILTIVTTGAVGYVIFNQLIQVLDELPVYKENIHNKIEAIQSPAKGALGRATENVKDLANELSTPQKPTGAPPQKERTIRGNAPKQADRPVPVQIVNEPANELQYLRDLTKSFLTPLGAVGIVLIFTVFLLIEQNDLRNRLFRLAGLSRLNLMTQALDDATIRVSRYLLLQFLVNAGFGMLIGVGLYFIGVPYAALWGTVAALLRIVPYVGSLIAGVLPLMLSLAVFDSWMPPLLVFLMFMFLELVTGNFIEPWLYGMHTGISSLALLLTTVFWTTLWGPSGLILSTPLTVCLVVLGRHVPQFSFLHVLLGDEPVLEIEAQLYQRLLAMDDQGARAVVDQYLTQNTMLQLYDAVLIPTMSMVEKDRHKGALDPGREEFIFMSMREMIGELSVRSLPPDDDTPVEIPEAGRFLCLPANDESDEITAAMLAQLLEAAGRVTISVPKDGRLPQTIRTISPTDEDVFCVSALPPFAFTRARDLCINLRRWYPKTKIIVCVWGYTGETIRAIERFQPAKPHHFVTSFASALNYLLPQEFLGSGGEGGSDTEP